MKIAIMKGGANITFSNNNKSAANADILYALRTIDPKKHECTIITHKTRNTFIPAPLKFAEVQNVKNLDNFDVLLMFNFSINFFGGAEDKNLLQMYRLMSSSHIPIVYVHTDGQLNFKQLWPSIECREWAKNYSSEEFYIDPERVVYLTQGRDHSKVMRSLGAKPDMITPKAIDHFSWERTILANHQKHFKAELKPFEDRNFWLIFGGASRNTHKKKLIEKYYTKRDLDTLVFGNLRGVSVGSSTVHPKVSYQDFIRKMQEGIATVTIGDLSYNDNFFTLRMYESILAGCLVLIDKQLDPNQKFYQNIVNFTDDLYVSNFEMVRTVLLGLGPSGCEEVASNIREEILNGYDLTSENKKLIDKLHWAQEVVH